MQTFGKTQKYYFLNRLKYIEGSLVKSSGKILREPENCWFEKKVYYVICKMAKKDVKVTICYVNISPSMELTLSR